MIHLFLFLVLHYCGLDPSTSTSNSEKKRRADDSLPPVLKKKKWTVNGPIRFDAVNQVYYVDPAEHDDNKKILQSVFDREIVMLIGARASGKTTRLYRLITQLTDFGYRCLPLSFEEVNVRNNESDFWGTFGDALRFSYKAVSVITTQREFLNAFSQIELKDEKFVILIDEFDELFKAGDEVRNIFLKTLRAMSRNNAYAIHSVIVCGTFSLQRLRTTDQHISPFNVNNTIRNPYFTLDQTQQLFNDYAKDEMIKIDDEIIRDVHSKSNGHPGMICLCGRSIHEDLRSKVNGSTKCLDYDTWQDFSTDNQNERMFSYHTFRRMVDSLLSESATDAVNLLRTYFIGYLGVISISDMEKQRLADFLTAEGVLIRLDGSKYCMASAFIDSFVRRYIIPSKYPHAPSESPPKKRGGSLDILEIMKIALRFFDKNLIMQAGSRSYKGSGKTVKVMGDCNVSVPRESVYDAELMRVLTNWLNKTEEYEIIGQWHLREREDHKYSDIVIKKAGKPTVVIELLATGSQTSIKGHISKTLTYKRLLPAEEAWVVHFTCEDDYFKYPYWQTDAELDQGANLVHFWHDRSFDTVRMNARWKDSGNTQRIDNELLTV
ncbi:P-loop containing nucleoside triphosphate hydrolase protein [Lobosporangium transversale]|uniref:p-loop containing nucleoside triphosphate hydrolase protein n=1 Tax=Lobosporangium transversale TaxID=64571 RepID=A0A1Y2G9D1_9FUNG|nr:P-loop containing nucleoside triphosphate hydrolase protein [Lobosporangium transversale]ORY98435.1 P-loop containing nucleoside triphosphate hydrolase protein [Lobosporangium transversale]|eukprot:XP_021875806.1 P-loop containing nucleoside triphosphate hydrolase protein [Lobosporangium transversale]